MCPAQILLSYYAHPPKHTKLSYPLCPKWSQTKLYHITNSQFTCFKPSAHHRFILNAELTNFFGYIYHERTEKCVLHKKMCTRPLLHLPQIFQNFSTFMIMQMIIRHIFLTLCIRRNLCANLRR